MAITYYSPPDTVLPETFGALGDGTTDDTTALQHAINTGKIVVGKRGSTYTVSSLTVSTPYQTIDLTGATLKRKNTTTGSLLRLTGNFTKVLGGNFGSYNQLHYLDRGFNVQIQYSDVYSTPESGVTAGVGSLFLSSIGGAGTTLFVKQAGTGNTGWAGK